MFLRKNMQRSKTFRLSWLIAVFSLLAAACFCSSEAMKVSAGKLDHFSLVISDIIVAGEPFTVKMTANDEFENIITDYGQTGSEIEIGVVGTGQIHPQLILASEFREGVLSKELIYNKAGNFTIFFKTRLDAQAAPEVMATKTIQALKAEEDQQMSLLEAELFQAQKSLEEKKQQNLELKQRLLATLSEMRDLVTELAEARELLNQTQRELEQQ
ncbi:MAG: hypothetical protein HQ595_00270 [Candidatus Omnitrophica bacterium]|nr:hypothetical protein [Candidatus Omnitrophota bacterium]